MNLTPDTIARIKACKGVYSVGDTAKHFGVSKSTVHRYWNGGGSEINPSPEPPNVKSSRISKDIVIEDGKTLLARTRNVTAAARELGVSPATLYNHLKAEGVQPCYFF